jgi:hypothetical protein
MRTVTYPVQGGTRHVQALRKASVEVSNLSKGEMCSNYSLSIYPYVFATIHRPTQGAGSAGAALLDLQLWHLPGACRRRFQVDGGRARTFSSGTSRGPAINVFMLMVGAPGPSTPTPPGGPPSTFSHLWWRARTISSDTSWGPSSTFSCWWWALPDLQL